jgi:hypothetical protein
MNGNAMAGPTFKPGPSSAQRERGPRVPLSRAITLQMLGIGEHKVPVSRAVNLQLLGIGERRVPFSRFAGEGTGMRVRWQKGFNPQADFGRRPSAG